VQLDLPSVEVRFEDLHIETSVYAESGRNVPNVLNAYRDIFEYAFLKVRGGVDWDILTTVPHQVDQ
jgi:hypothetical protein